MRFFAEFNPSTSLRTGLSGVRFFPFTSFRVRMTRGEGVRMAWSEGLRMTRGEGVRMAWSEGLRMTRGEGVRMA
jgi:hypothetical protein